VSLGVSGCSQRTGIDTEDRASTSRMLVYRAFWQKTQASLSRDLTGIRLSANHASLLRLVKMG